MIDEKFPWEDVVACRHNTDSDLANTTLQNKLKDLRALILLREIKRVSTRGMQSEFRFGRIFAQVRSVSYDSPTVRSWELQDKMPQMRQKT